MDMQLDGRVALITGAASGIGLACTQAIVAEGAKVLIIDRSASGADEAKKLRAQGYNVEFYRADITSEPEIKNAIEFAKSTFGQIDILIGCAGISGPVGSLSTEISVEDWNHVMAVNVRANFLMAKNTIPILLGSDVANIVFMASDSALVAFEGMAPYCASKGALLMLTKALCVDHPSVRVNCLCPGIVDTPMSREDLGRPDGFDGTNLPVVKATQIARHAVFLASPVSAPINGTALVVDFGYLARSALPNLEFM